MKNKKFFLGGPDAEMKEIKRVLTKTNNEYCDKNLPWGAKAISYLSELKSSILQGYTPVLIELNTQKLPKLILKKCIVIDHHNTYKHREASILQVLHLLKLQPSHKQLLIAANDSGYIPEMIRKGATMKEIEEIRHLDWLAQGITPQKAEQVLKEYTAREVQNNVIIVRQKEFCFAPATDKAFFEQKQQNILFICEDGRTVWFNTPEKVAEVYQKFTVGGWCGQTFVGNARPEVQDEMVEFILSLNK